MSDIDYLDLYVCLAGFRLVVLANQLGCDNPVAQRAHKMLIAKLDELTTSVAAVLRAKRAHAYDPENDDVYWEVARFENVWLAEPPHPLLDFLVVDEATREFCDNRSQSWHFFDHDWPTVRDVSDAKLCGLRGIMDRIANETGIQFSAYRVFYDADDFSRADEADYVASGHLDCPVFCSEEHPLCSSSTD